MTARIAELAALIFAPHASSFDGAVVDGAVTGVGDGAGWAAQPSAMPHAVTRIVMRRSTIIEISSIANAVRWSREPTDYLLASRW